LELAMPDESWTRREVLAAAAAVGMAALAGRAAGEPRPGTAPDKLPRGSGTIGIQMGLPPLATQDLDRLFDDLHRLGGVNALFPFIYTYAHVTAGMPAKGFHGGNFAIPHMQFYGRTPLNYQDMRATDFGDLDVMARIIPVAKKHGMKTFAWVLEDHDRAPSASWEKLYEVDFHGRPALAHPAGPCYNNPLYLGFVLGLIEDYTRSYDIDGVMWSSERQGGFFNALGAYAHGASADPGRATCFCDFCTKKAKDLGIDVQRAKRGFTELEQWVRNCRAARRPRDGFFVTFFRLLLNYPELLAWENLWIRSREDLQLQIYKLVKSIKPAIPVGWHIWHNVSFSPFHRAEMDYSRLAKFSDFIKPVLYNNAAGERIRSFVDSARGNVFGDLPPEQAMDVLYRELDYDEAGYDKVKETGLSADYVMRETQRAVDDVKANGVEVWPGIDIDVPVPAGSSQCTADGVKQAVLAAFRGGATGLVLSRNYSEMNPDHLAGAGAALKELGLG
jgi:hypothetical protein